MSGRARDDHGDRGPRTPEELRATWDGLAESDALWAVVTLPEKRHGTWTREELFETGRREFRDVMAYAESLGHPRQRRRVLDFGCGVGRVTQAMAPEYFETAEGVDISPRMLELARKFNEGNPARRFHLNLASNLALFEDDRFDLVYSTYVLQHTPPGLIRGYVTEMVRVLAPGGLLLVQLPSERAQGADRPLPEDAFRADLRVDAPPRLAAPGEALRLTVHVRNTGGAAWPAIGTDGRFHVALGNHWLDADGAAMAWDDARAYLPRALEPGDETTVDLLTVAPERPGRHILEIDLVQEGVRWFAQAGQEPLRIPVHVRRRLGDILSVKRRRPTRSAAEEIEMGMHGVDVEVMTGWLREAGAELIEVRDPLAFGSQFLARDWVDRCYAVTKSPR